MTKEELKQEAIQYACDYPINLKGYKRVDIRKAYLAGAEPREKHIADLEEQNKWLEGCKSELAEHLGNANTKIADLEAQIKKMKWHKLDWDKAEECPDVDKLVRVRTRSGAEYICETYSYYPAEDEIGYGSVIIQFAELNGDWIDDNEIEYWCEIESFKEIKEND